MENTINYNKIVIYDERNSLLKMPLKIFKTTYLNVMIQCKVQSQLKNLIKLIYCNFCKLIKSDVKSDLSSDEMSFD